MANVFDTAQYILSKTGGISTWKLQKLVYYSQAWHSVWSDQSLFDSRIEAWANGPVCPALYEQHKGRFTIDNVALGNVDSLTADEKESIDVVVNYYGKYNGQQLSDMTHSESPWQKARDGLSPNERGNEEITLESMVEYYTSL
ncbi:Panacea domain-containing protein [Pseudorhodoplanes sp.]|uniref:Panacea domain-containing protein n=1 Tax=Pseudorhodoplanes sp. TaxID=1934341 RepID=UPI003D0A7178